MKINHDRLKQSLIVFGLVITPLYGCAVLVKKTQTPTTAVTPAVDKDAFYMMVDANGKMQMVAKKTVTPATSPAEPTSPLSSAKSITPPAPATQAFNAETFVDSEYLEAHEFNLTQKKKFYAMPDGTGKTQIVEMETGVNLKKFEPPVRDTTPITTISPLYERMSKAQMTDLLGESCIAPKRLKDAKVLKQVPLGVWPLKSFKPELRAEFVRLDQDITDIHLLSFAATNQSPRYYWPLIAFLDQQGCVFAGASHFFQSQKPATAYSYSALQGNFLVPEGARYLMLTPLQQSSDLSGVALIESGQLQLKVIDASDAPAPKPINNELGSTR